MQRMTIRPKMAQLEAESARRERDAQLTAVAAPPSATPPRQPPSGHPVAPAPGLQEWCGHDGQGSASESSLWFCLMNFAILRWALSSLLEVRSTCASMSSSILQSADLSQLRQEGRRDRDCAHAF